MVTGCLNGLGGRDIVTESVSGKILAVLTDELPVKRISVAGYR